MKKVFVIPLMIVLVSGLIFGGCVAPPPEVPAPEKPEAPTPEVFVWKAQFNWYKGDTTRDFAWEPALKAIQEKSGGRLVINTFEPGALVPVEGMLSAAGTGAIDLALAAASRYPIIPQDLGIIDSALPMAWSTPEDAWSIYYEHGLLDLLREVYMDSFNVYYPGPAGGSANYGFSTAFPVTSLDDFKGKKIRASASMTPMVEAIGALPVYVPGAELYMALKLGTVDGMCYSMSGFITQKFGEVITHVILPSLKCPPTAVWWINLDSWNTLPKDLQNLIEKEISDNFIPSTNRGIERDEESIYGADLVVVQLSDEEINKLRELAYQTWEITETKGPLAEKAVKIIKDYYGR